MSRRVRYSVTLENDGEIFDGVEHTMIIDAVEQRLPEECDVDKCYYEDLRERGERAYVSVLVADKVFAVDDLVERNEQISDAVLTGVESVVDGDRTDVTVEGWD